ncbi:MAG: OmpA family protein [Nitrospira sp.]|nr:OmpA family protein [Nitrospira sp.]
MSQDVSSTTPEVGQLAETMNASESLVSGTTNSGERAKDTEERQVMDIAGEAPPVPTFHENQSVQPIFATPQTQGNVGTSSSSSSSAGENLVASEPDLVGNMEEMEMIQEPISQQLPLEIAKLSPREPEIVQKEQRIEEFLRALEDVYFDYDRFGLRKEAYPELVANAEVLSTQLSDRTILLEGHCDERGTESYNMILGKRRALAVKDYLVDLGVPGDKLQVVSFGKEKPFCHEQTRECWQANRRVHFAVK